MCVENKDNSNKLKYIGLYLTCIKPGVNNWYNFGYSKFECCLLIGKDHQVPKKLG